MATMTIAREQTETHGRYSARVEGVDGEAELTYSLSEPSIIIADHTYTPPSMRGMGIAKALVERLVADARAEKLRVIPLCSYIQAQYLHHPEWSDVIQGTALGR